MVASVLAGLIVLGALFAVAIRPIHQRASRTVHASPAELEHVKARLSDKRTVSFTPIGTKDSSPVSVARKVDADKVVKGKDVELDANVHYQMSATVDGGKDCKVAFSPRPGRPM